MGEGFGFVYRGPSPSWVRARPSSIFSYLLEAERVRGGEEPPPRGGEEGWELRGNREWAGHAVFSVPLYLFFIPLYFSSLLHRYFFLYLHMCYYPPLAPGPGARAFGPGAQLTEFHRAQLISTAPGSGHSFFRERLF